MICPVCATNLPGSADDPTLNKMAHPTVNPDRGSRVSREDKAVSPGRVVSKDKVVRVADARRVRWAAAWPVRWAIRPVAIATAMDMAATTPGTHALRGRLGRRRKVPT